MRFLIITKKQLMLGICALIAVIAVVIGSAAAFAGNDRKAAYLLRGNREKADRNFI